MSRGNTTTPASGRFFTTPVTLSLLGCVGSAVLCLVSVWHPLHWSDTRDFYSFRYQGPDFQVHRCVALKNGVLHAQAVQLRSPVSGWPVKAVYRGYPLAFPFVPNVLGFSVQLSNPTWSSDGGYYREASIPVWLVTLVAVVVPWRRFLLWRRGRNVGLCTRCRYDLTANASGVCPECGTAIPLINE